jgi:cellulose synthase/poly-beta-1,6-N-acetylglucosamine synthase-like glycosyltransferase
MTMVWLALLLGCVGAIGYVLVGYPLLLRLIVLVRGPRLVSKADITPPVSLVISAFNEADVIATKLDNALALDYPRDLLEIVVISDASDDETDGIVTGYADRGVILRRQQDRRGKTAGLNATVPTLAGDIVVFSDANAMYEPDAIRMLVRNFADRAVGCVTGEARYEGDADGAADEGEGAYWNYEMQLKRRETAVGSSVGGDGAIYAIRKPLWQTLPEDGINDFLNPLQIVAAGWRGVYEPEAVCYEEAAGDTGKEYRRRVRIISRSWRAIWLAADVLKPWKVGLFALSVFSHKVLRWFTGLFLLGAVVSTIALMLPIVISSPPWMWAVMAVLVLGAMALPASRRVLQVMWYFGVLNLASLVGLIKGTLGSTSGVWSTPRQTASVRAKSGIVDLWTGSALLAGVLLLAWLGVMLEGHPDAVRVVFWTSLASIVYLFVGYPALVATLGLIRHRPVVENTRTADLPTVTVLVAAHDEEDVIAGKMENCLALDYPPERLRIVVASDGSRDRTNAIARTFMARGVELQAYPQRRGKIATIAATMLGVDSEIVVLTDANAFLRPDALRALVRNFDNPRVGAVSGDVVLTGDRAALAQPEDLYYKYERWLQRAESELGSMVGVDGALYAVRRHLFEPPPDDTVLDDMAVPMAVVRKGYRVIFETEAIAFEHGSRSAWEEFSRKTRIVAGAVQFLRRGFRQIPWRAPQAVFSLLSHKVLRWLSPVIGSVFFMSCFALRGEGVAFAALWWTAAVAMGIGLLGCVESLRRLLPIGVCYYFGMVHVAAATGMLRGLVGGQAVAWQRFPRTPVTPA